MKEGLLILAVVIGLAPMFVAFCTFALSSRISEAEDAIGPQRIHRGPRPCR